MSFQVLKSLFGDDISETVFEFFLLFGFPSLLLFVGLELLPESDCVFDGSDVGEMSRVRDAQTAHSVGVPPFGKVTLESLGPPICLQGNKEV